VVGVVVAVAVLVLVPAVFLRHALHGWERARPEPDDAVVSPP
jgi:hypothetical protein